MAKFLVNLGGSVYVHAKDEQAAIEDAKKRVHKDVNIFHTQAQQVEDPEDHTLEKRQAKFDEEVAANEHSGGEPS